jgi:hypothetical protein
MHHLPSRRRLHGEARTQPLLGFCGERLHGVPRDDPSLTAREGSLCPVQACGKFRTQQFAFLPQEECFGYHIFGALDPAGLDGLSDKRFLVRGKGDVHVMLSSIEIVLRSSVMSTPVIDSGDRPMLIDPSI